MEFEQALAVLRALEREGVRYALVGSMAMAAQGLVRATQDLDLFVDPTPDNVERLKRALRSVFDDPCIDEIAADDLSGEYPAIRYVPPDGTFSVDLLARLGEAFSFDDIETETLEIEGVHLRVATPRMLVRMKRDTLRPLDHADAAALRRRFGIEDE
ncbi:MAG: nucleotidyl transferase AbiEii/AbiGii toxin family protein [Myxococcota bacterium]